MDRYVVAGNPVEHSQSPFIHALFAKATGEPVEYGRLLAPLDGFEATIRRFAGEGGRGCNVTVPFKFDAFKLAPHHTDRAALAQAANVLRFDAQGWMADNTDGAGLVSDIERNAGVALRGKKVLLIGAGGASAGVLGPLIRAGSVEVVVANRSVDKAQALVERHRAAATLQGTALRAASLDQAGSSYDVVVNGTAASLSGAGIPVGAQVLREGTLALDMMYGPPARGFLDWAASHGAIGRDGLGMLVEQAAEAFLFWRGVRPATAAVLAALRERLAAKA
ncbi:shikimate dehydrogenase [Piscinibacter terrae]|uniref:Shikimate dehydrogenase (NADP(+)) n=1 Tax=Piscinibacter terrae TaxID=2496871 RepID=A0A3N7HQ34_9BURK|nr:shikimate dehydrogenase [Albitalea terrae]RQP23256.1 shikimate dehydrogenase [Albitalea terrae]